MILSYSGNTPQARLNDCRRWLEDVRHMDEMDAHAKWGYDKWDLMSDLRSDEKELEDEARAVRQALPAGEVWLSYMGGECGDARMELSKAVDFQKDVELMSDRRCRNIHGVGKKVLLARVAHDIGKLRSEVDDMDEREREAEATWLETLDASWM